VRVCEAVASHIPGARAAGFYRHAFAHLGRETDVPGRVECRALFAQETPMDLQLCYNTSEDTFPLPLHI
jgi:hypothetical protein